MKKAERIIYFSAILLLFFLSATYCARYYALKNEFAVYRRRQFTRAYECLYAKLEEFDKAPDGSLSPQISTFIYMLPLSESEMRIAEKFCTDIANSDTDEEAAKRAEMYCGILRRFLSEERADNYERGYLSVGLGLPAYEFDGITASVMPAERSDLMNEMRQNAEELLGTDRLTVVTVIENGVRLVMFRTQRSYALYSPDGTFVRSLIR